MKNKNLVLTFDEEEFVSVELLKLKQKIPYHELFFKINQQNSFYFSRRKDLVIEDDSGYYQFPVFEGFDEVRQITYTIIANQSYDFRRKEKQIVGLFDLIEEEKFFINSNIDFILFSKEGETDFSALNLPKDWFYTMQNCSLNLEDELYQIILDYDE
ncbi:MAG: IPExxxVDY family protein [Flavobacteriaceae bacterium]|nr:IPExxxVDY family protein [Flavobacteriaceae bacterium]